LGTSLAAATLSEGLAIVAPEMTAHAFRNSRRDTLMVFLRVGDRRY
jgi:hypothetical protein